MRFRLTIFGGSLLELEIGDNDTADDDERLTFGFASIVGSSDLNDDAKMLDTADRTR